MRVRHHRDMNEVLSSASGARSALAQSNYGSQKEDTDSTDSRKQLNYSRPLIDAFVFFLSRTIRSFCGMGMQHCNIYSPGILSLSRLS